MPRWTSYALATALSLTIVSCASNADTGFPDPSEVPSEEPVPTCGDIVEEPVEVDEQIYVLDNCYVPKIATVAAGAEVLWVQAGQAPHTVTFTDLEIDSHPTCSNEAISECMAKDDEFSATFDTPGEYIYYCVIHGGADGTGMAATIVVE